MDIGFLRGLLTVTLFALFLGIAAWSWSRKRKDDFDRAANLPLEDDTRPPLSASEKEQSS